MANIARLEIDLLCKNICNQVKGVSKITENSPVEQVRQICGKSECTCRGFSPFQNLSYLLKVVSRSYLTDQSIILSIINNYNCLSHQKHCQDVLEHILKHVMRNQTQNESRDHLFNLLWQHPAFSEFTTNVVEEFLFTESRFIEEDIINGYENVLNGHMEPAMLWKMLLYDRIVMWGSKSTKVFSLVTSILNVWLQYAINSTNNPQLCLSVVTEFIISIKNKCNDNESDFVLLYPKEYHSLVTLLDIKPSLFPDNLSETSVTLSKVLDKIQASFRLKPIQTACLLSHFPEWAYIIDR